MSVTVTDSGSEPRSRSIGPLKQQTIRIVANSGATSGTVTADCLSRVIALIAPSRMRFSAAKTYSGNVTTIAFTVPAETAASRTIDGVLYTAVANQGVQGNLITIQEVDGTGDTIPVTKGNETVFVTGSAIVVHIDPTAVSGSARDDVKAAIIASAAASALVVPSTVTAGTTVAVVTAATPLQSGVTGGSSGDAIAIGY